MSNTLAVLNNVKGAEEIEMLSPQVVDMINGFRAEEGNRAKLTHPNFMKKIRKEMNILKSAGFDNEVNFYLVEYLDKKGEKRPCYRMNRNAILQMAASESAIVRAKIIQYIEALENRLKQQQISTDQIAQMINEAVKAAVAPYIDRIEKLTAPKEAPKTRTANFRTLPTVTKIAKPFGMTGTDANKILEKHGIIRRSDNGKGSILNEEYEDRWGTTIYEDGKEPYVRYFDLGVNSITKIFSRITNASEQEQLNLF